MNSAVYFATDQQRLILEVFSLSYAYMVYLQVINEDMFDYVKFIRLISWCFCTTSYSELDII